MRIQKLHKPTDQHPRLVLVSATGALDAYLTDRKELAYVKERLSGEKNWSYLLGPEHRVLFGLLEGTAEKLHDRLELSRKMGFEIQSFLNEHQAASLIIENAGVSADECLALAEGLALSSYQFLKYFSEDKAKVHALKEIHLLDENLDEEAVGRLDQLVKAVFWTRDLVNEPLSYLTAVQLAKEMEAMGKEAGFAVEVFNKKKIDSLKMGGLLAVNRGSPDPPTFSILSWKPENAVNQRPLVIVGKGVVYDTGGLSLKPTKDSMDYMKSDMGGAAAVAGAMYALAANKLPLWVIGLVPATDNRPDGNAYVPGDVVRMYNGSTVEVLNTDAEGRMILADALSYAKQYDPELVIELSTLTGSAQAAIGKYGLVGMGNAGEAYMKQLKECGEYCSERIAEMPFWDEYKEELKSIIADLKNIGGRNAGAITAGKFLEHFTDYPFIHLDIAGPSFNKQAYNYRGKGGSGVGVRILYHYFMHRIQ